MAQKNEKTCWACHRVIVGKSVMGLCPNCVNKYGSTAVAVAVLGLAVRGRNLIKNGGKIAKTVAEVTKIFKA